MRRRLSADCRRIYSGAGTLSDLLSDDPRICHGKGSHDYISYHECHEYCGKCDFNQRLVRNAAAGAVGAAISTDISKLVGLALMIGMFFKSHRVKMGMSYLRPFPVQILKNLCLLAIPTGVESFSYNLPR